MNFVLCFFTSSDAICSDVISANFSSEMVPHNTFSRSSGFFLSLRLKTRLRIWFLYLGLVDLNFRKMASSIISARSSGHLTVPSGSWPSPLSALASILRQLSRTSSVVAAGLGGKDFPKSGVAAPDAAPLSAPPAPDDSLDSFFLSLLL